MRNYSQNIEKTIHRIIKYLEYIGVSPSAYEKRLGLGNGSLKKQLKVSGSVGSDVVEKILSTDPSLNPNWLLTGQGSMILESKTQPEVLENNVTPIVTPIVTPTSNNVLNEPSEIYNIGNRSSRILPIITIEEQSDQTGAMCVMVDAKAAAGWPGSVDSPLWYQALPQFRLPLFYKGEFLLIQVSGDSMEPTLSDTDWVVAKRIFDIEDIREGYVHLVLLEDGPVVKRVYSRLDKGVVQLVSDNKAYNPVMVPITSILHIYKVEMFFSTTLGAPENSIMAHIQRLDNAINDMSKELNKLKRSLPK